jgi:hypothetical protein
MSQPNLVSMVISEEDEADVMQSLDRIEARLKGMVSMAAHGRRFKRMGPKEETRARNIIRTLQQNPQMVPPGLDLAGATADLEALERMSRIEARMQRLAALAKDTRAALGVDIMGVASVGYTMSKAFGGALGLKDKVKEFGSRFSNGRKKANPEDGAGA